MCEKQGLTGFCGERFFGRIRAGFGCCEAGCGRCQGKFWVCF